jgi:hypothetical protein
MVHVVEAAAEGEAPAEVPQTGSQANVPRALPIMVDMLDGVLGRLVDQSAFSEVFPGQKGGPGWDRTTDRGIMSPLL